MKYSEMKKEAEKVGALKPLTPTYFEFDKKGEELVGRYKGRSAVKSSLGPGEYCQYLFDTDDGLIKVALGQALDKEAGALMEAGKAYSITYEGKVKISGGRSVNKYSVRLIEEEAIFEREPGEEE